MKGLILKDLYMIFKHSKFIYLLALIFGTVYIFDSVTAYWFIVPVVLSGIVPITILSLDEQSKWTYYSDVLPGSRKNTVCSKYILSLLSVFTTWFVIAVMRGVSGMIMGNIILFDYVTVLLSSLALGLITPSLLLPTIFKYGFEKGRVAYYMVAFLLVGIGSSLGLIINETSTVNMVGKYILPILIITIIVAIVFFGSWLLSLRFYKNRELN